MELNRGAEKLISCLTSAGYKAYTVGGCVRDSILGRQISDFDICTSALPEQVEAVLSANGVRFIETGLKHGTVTAIVGKAPYEITTFRSDGEYLDNRRPESVTFVSDVTDDLARRDFTVNAMAFNKNEGLIDLFGGREDIENKIIRAVGNANERFNEDALRIMRALRFAAVLGFEIEPLTQKAIFENKELLLNIAAERIYAELTKLLLGDYCEGVLLTYREVLAVVIPELKPCFDFPQNSKWHIYDVYTHIVRSVALSPKKDYMRYAMLFHDIAKPQCKTTDEKGQDHFKGHPKLSAEIAQTVLKRLRVSNDVLKKALTLIEIHDCYITEKPSNIKKWLRQLGEDMTYDYIEFKIADLATHNAELSAEEIETLRRIKTQAQQIVESGEPYRISDLKINGIDLTELGFKGWQIQDELENLIAQVSGNPACNVREKLLNFAARDLKNYN